jgi:hypothetical protein
VADHGEEPDVATRRIDRGRDRAAARVIARRERCEIDDRNDRVDGSLASLAH